MVELDMVGPRYYLLNEMMEAEPLTQNEKTIVCRFCCCTCADGSARFSRRDECIG